MPCPIFRPPPLRLEARSEPLHSTASYRLFLSQLVQARRDRGVTQEELATRLSLSPVQVAKFELGERQLDFVQTMQWCQALGVSFLEFMVRLNEEITAQLSQNESDQTEGGTQ